MVDLALKLPDNFLEEEEREGYLVSGDMKQVWAVELDLLSQMITLLEEKGLSYFIHGGTLLGAIRHKGFIPWDDDLDILMPRSDFDRLCDIAGDFFNEPYFFQTEKSDPGFLLRHAKLRNSETAAIQNSLKKYNCKFNQGIFLDIFPIDNIPDDLSEREKWYSELWNRWGKVWSFSAFFNRDVKKAISSPIKKFYYRCLHHLGMNDFYNNKYEECARRYVNQETEECCEIVGTVLPGGNKTNYTWRREWFRDSVLVDFEFLKVKAPIMYNEFLTKLYGDWHKIVRGSSSHGEVFFDVNKSYKEYLKCNK